MFLSGGKSVSPGENGEAVEKVDSSTEEIHEELREQFLEITENLLVKPGQYFDKNWHSCRECGSSVIVEGTTLLRGFMTHSLQKVISEQLKTL